MTKLYLDIDGVLLTTKNTRRPEYAVEFIDFVTSTFDCYWLTTHCREGERSIGSLLRYLADYYDAATIDKLSKIKPATWSTVKTEGIDWDSDFYWLDDYLFEAERRVLELHRKLDRCVEVNLNNENELLRIKRLLEAKIAPVRKFLFLDIDGVLNAGVYSKYLEDHGLVEFDKHGALFDPQVIENLRHIIDSTQADIVIISTWRFDGLHKMRQLWKDRDLPDDVIGVTPMITKIAIKEVYSPDDSLAKDIKYTPCGRRGMEIDAWLNNTYPLRPCTYAILDDVNDYLLHQADNVVLTNPMTGITEEIADKAIEILNKEVVLF